MISTCGLFIVNKENKVLICHPTHHPATFFSIPKGKKDDEDIDCLSAALRETYEETNIDLRNVPNLKIYYLGSNTYKSKKKKLYSFLVFEDEFPENIGFNLSDIEIKCNSMVENDRPFPENDLFIWVSISEAKGLLHESQIPSLIEIEKIYANFKSKK